MKGAELSPKSPQGLRCKEKRKKKKLSFDSKDEVWSAAVASGNRETKKWKTEKAAQPVFETLCM